MNRQALIDYRKERLQALVDQKFDGSKAALGRALGYKDGAFVGQMLRGERPISEKTVDQVHGLTVGKDWFTGPVTHPAAQEPPAAYHVHSPDQAIESMGKRLAMMEAPVRERASSLMANWARDPDGPWAAWLGELFSSELPGSSVRERTLVIKSQDHVTRSSYDESAPAGRSAAAVRNPAPSGDALDFYNLGEITGEPSPKGKNDSSKPKRVQK